MSDSEEDAQSPDQVPLGFHQTLLRQASHESLKSLTEKKGLEHSSPRNPNCICFQVFSDSDIRNCQVCHGSLLPIAKLAQEQNSISQGLANSKKKLELFMAKQFQGDTGKLRKRIFDLEEVLEVKQDEINKMRDDMEILGQKLIDETEKRAEIQHANENVTTELEELTQSLFEEANNMVANEKRERFGAQVNLQILMQEKQQLLAKQLYDTNLQLQMEQAQAREFRLRISQLEQVQEDALLAQSRRTVSLPQISSPTSLDSDPKYLVDTELLAQFVELKERAPKVKMTKIHDILFMRNALEDDVTPCLRFGGNPRTSTKKFIDAIIANTCFIEEMETEQIKELEDRDARVARNSQTSLLEKADAPTTSLFNKTVLERITNALTTPREVDEKGGCSTCGRDEPYRFRFKISDIQQDIWYPICHDCRSRLFAVVDFYQFIRNMRQGLFTSRNTEDLYLEALNLKRLIWYARIGAGSHRIKNPEGAFHQLEPLRPSSSSLSIESIDLPAP
jgi:hypothetical protein